MDSRKPKTRNPFSPLRLFFVPLAARERPARERRQALDLQQPSLFSANSSRWERPSARSATLAPQTDSLKLGLSLFAAAELQPPQSLAPLRRVWLLLARAFPLQAPKSCALCWPQFARTRPCANRLRCS